MTNIFNKKLYLVKNTKLIFSNDKNTFKVKKDHVLIKVLRSSICSSDINRVFYNGAYHYPIILGHELSGEIVNISKNIKNINKFKVGDKVGVYPLKPCFICKNCKKEDFNYCFNYSYYGSREDGGFCQYIHIAYWNLIKINNLDINFSSIIEPVAVSLESLKILKNYKNKKILIVGSGFIGSVICKFLSKKINKKNLFIIDRNTNKLLIHKNYANIINLDITSNQNTKFKEEEFDYIFDASGTTGTLGLFINKLNYFGKLVLINNHYGKNIIGKSDTSLIMRKNLTITGSWNSEFKSNRLIWKKSISFIKNNYNFFNSLCYGPINFDELPKYIYALKNKIYRDKKFNPCKIIINNESS